MKGIDLGKSAIFFLVFHSLHYGAFSSTAWSAPPEVNIANCPLSDGRGSAGVLNTKMATDGSFVYQAGTDASTWSGSLKKLQLVQDDAVSSLEVATTADWDAGEILTGIKGQSPNPGADARSIFSSYMQAGESRGTIEFKWDKLSAAQQALLNVSPVDGKGDKSGEKRLNYLRGVRSLERGRPEGIFRARSRILGDIVNSNPVIVGAPAVNVSGPDYQKFYDDNKGRTRAVYVGANDGLLHAFSSVDGKELFAYLPNVLIQGVNQLTSPDYIHRPYVDGPMTVSEARLGTKWKTILVSGLGGGAQGLFALDVTNPADFGGGLGAVFEFSDNDDPDMGNLIGVPLVAKFRTKLTNGVPEYRYFVVVSSGLNNYKNDGASKFSETGASALFLLSLDKAQSEKWALGVNYYKFRLPEGDANLQNGLSAPALVAGSDGAARIVYAGDLQGNLWRFDFSGFAPWSNVFGTAPHRPLFTAKDADGIRQPITSQAKIVFAPGGGHVVLFGTGKYVESADTVQGNFRTQSFYGIYDSGQEADRVSNRSQLMVRVLKKTSINGSDAFAVTGNDFIYGVSANNKKGWYVDFLESGKTGERVATNPLIAYGKLFFNSLLPGKDPCGPGGSRAYVLDALTGLSPGSETIGDLSNAGMTNTPILLEAGVHQADDRSVTGQRIVKKKYAVLNFGRGAGKAGATPTQTGLAEASIPAGRFSWREVLNWPDLRETFRKK